MSGGVGELSAIVGITAFSVTALIGCIKGFALLQSAACAGRDLSTIRVMIQCEQQKLHSWANEVGLFDEPQTLRVNSNDARRIPPILEQLEELLTDVGKLKSAFGLDIEITDEEVELLDYDAADVKSLLPWQRYQFSTTTAKIFHKRQTLWRKLRWVSGDEEQVRKLLGPVRYFIGELRDYLDRAQRGRHENQVEIMLRALVMNSTDQHYLSMVSEEHDPKALGAAVSAAARLRQKGLMLGLLDGPSAYDFKTDSVEQQSFHAAKQGTRRTARIQRPRSISLTSMRLSKRQLGLAEPLSPHVLRQLAYYNDKLVLLEWRIVEDATYKAAKSRVNKISHLLHELVDPSFHSLQCIGFLEDPDMRRYGFVLEVPAAVLSGQRVTNTLQSNHRPSLLLSTVSLRELFDTVACPSLNLRLGVAITVLETILQLHTSGWLHKALRSDNVLMFKSSASTSKEFTELVQPLIYLTGYTYARVDDPSESTEPSPLQVDAELYRHPLSLGTSRMRYRIGFDVFSLGCILLELGLWSSISRTLGDALSFEATTTVGTSQSEPQVLAASLMTAKHKFVSGFKASDVERNGFTTYIMERVEAAAGKAYTKVVSACLKAVDVDPNRTVRGENDYLLELENASLVQLRRIAEHI